MGSKGDKKSGLVGEKSHSVYSANWKLDTMLEKELSMLDTSKHRVEHRIAMDQMVVNKRFQVKLQRSKVFHARMKGDKEMLKKLITKDNFNFHTKSSSVDVLNKQRERDLAKKRILHRESQEKMMMYRSATPAATPIGIKIPDLPGAESENSAETKSETRPSKTVRPMTAIERITEAKLLASRTGKTRPKTAVDRSKSSTVGTLPNAVKSPFPVSATRPANKMKVIPESNAAKRLSCKETEAKADNNKETREIVIDITLADDELNQSETEKRAEVKQENESIDQSRGGNLSNLPKTTQSTDPDQCGKCNDCPSFETVTSENVTNENAKSVTSKNVPKKSSLRPTTAPGTTSASKHSNSLSPPNLSRPRTSVSISEPIHSDHSDNESVTSTCRRSSTSQSRTGRRKSSKSKRKKSAFNIFEDQKKLTIMDIDEERRQHANHKVRIDNYVNTLDGVKTDPDLIVDYYMARLLEESSIAGNQKNVERIRDMPDSDYDLDLAKRSLGNLEKNTITFRDVNRNYDEYKHDPYSPLHPTSIGYGLVGRTSTMTSLHQHDSLLAAPTSAWQIDEQSDTDSD